MKRKALGKGLSALRPDPDAPGPAPEAGLEVPVESLEPNPYQPRSPVDPEALTALAGSIRESGIVQPILVRRVGPRFQIIAGERRWRAAQRLGLATVPVTVRDVPDDRLLELALVENIQRADLSPLEEALAYRQLIDEFGLTHETLASRLGKNRVTVTNTLRLLGLGRSYIPGGGVTAINTLPFAGNNLTSDAVRYARTVAIIEAEPALGLGSPTVGWVDAAFRVMTEFADPAYASRLRQPMLLVAAGQDRIVSTPAIGAFARRLRAGSHLVIPGARHEILMEQDRYREQFWAAFDAFVPGSPLF